LSKIERRPLPALLAAHEQATALAAKSPDMVYTVPEVADILKVSRATVFNAMRAGKIKTIKILGNTRITSEEVRRLATIGTLATPEQSQEFYDYAARPTKG
jgi:excisionase family DNA binding protein